MQTGPGTSRDGSHESDSAPTVLQQQDIPEAIRALSTIADPDYVDLFTLRTSSARDRSPEQWARAVFEDALGYVKGFLIWRVIIGLRLKRRGSPDCVAGWEIADRGEDWLRMAAHSWMLTAHLVFQTDDEQVSLATFIRYNHPVAARAWPRLSRKHRAAAPALLREAHRAQTR